MRDFDYGKLAKRDWDTEILGLIAQIHEFKVKQAYILRENPAIQDRLVEIAKVQSTLASNKIEGIVTTSARAKQLCAQKTAPRNRDEEEIMGYRDVLHTIHENYEHIPFRASYILQLHRDLYRYSQRGIGGRFKNVQNYITEIRADGSEYVRFTPLPPYETPGAIDAICESMRRAIDDAILDPLILIPVCINDFLCIHPFNDGNGRMSRLLTTLLLYRSGYDIGKYISLENLIEKTKSVYYDVLAECSAGWTQGRNDPTPFIKYLLGIILCAYRDFDERASGMETSRTALERVRLAVRRRIGKFTKRDILELCPDIGKSSVENALKALIAQGEIERRGKGRSTCYVRVE